MDKGMPLKKELAMPDLHKAAEKEATGTYPKSFPGMKDNKVKNIDKSGGYCGVTNAK